MADELPSIEDFGTINSSIDLPVDPETLPLHVLGKEPRETEREVGRLVVADTRLWRRYGGWLATFHETSWREAVAMARAARGEVDMDLTVFKENLPELLKQLGWKRVLKTMGPKGIVAEMGPDWFVSQLTPEQRREFKKLLQ